MMWVLVSLAVVVFLVVADDLVRTMLGHQTIYGVIRRRRAMRRAFEQARARARQIDPSGRAGVVLFGSGRPF